MTNCAGSRGYMASSLWEVDRIDAAGFPRIINYKKTSAEAIRLAIEWVTSNG